MAVIEKVVEQHMDDGAFAWLLRNEAVVSSNFSLRDLASLDEKLEAHLDAILVAEKAGYDSSRMRNQLGDVGTVFTASVLALRTQSSKVVGEVIESASTSKVAEGELISALGWVEDQYAMPALQRLVESSDSVIQKRGFAGRAIRREVGEPETHVALGSANVDVVSRALRSAGEMGHRELLPQVRDQLRSEDEACRFWAAWSCVLLGDKSAAETLKSFVDFQTEFASRAMQLAPRVLDLADSQQWLRGLAQMEGARRLALVGCGVVGDPVYISTLIGQMSVPEYARVAGESFSMITGVDLAYEDLETDWPEGFEAGPTEDPEDEDVELDPDEDLPWPHQQLIQEWWDKHSRAYQAGRRYLCGQPISEANCRRVLIEGYQRQRISAAYELALMNPDEPLFEWRAPGWRQQEWLGLRKPRRQSPAVV